MFPGSTKLIPELQHYLYEFIRDSNLNKNIVLAPSDISSTYLSTDISFIRLLFYDSWPYNYDHYRYLYRLTSRTEYPFEIRNRLMIYPNSAQYYVCDSDNTSVCNVNIFNLQSDDLMMLDKLMEFRIDSTSSTLIDIDYDVLSTSLSKLIFGYITIYIDDDISIFDNDTFISTSDEILASLYETYCLEAVFNHISSKGS